MKKEHEFNELGDINTMVKSLGDLVEKEVKGEPFVVKELRTKADLYKQRNAIYGDNYHRFGPIFSLLMENQSLNVKSTHDMARLGVLVQLVSKITRYAENFNRGGHDDSLDDIAVYAMMLKELDQK